MSYNYGCEEWHSIDDVDLQQQFPEYVELKNLLKEVDASFLDLAKWISWDNDFPECERAYSVYDKLCKAFQQKYPQLDLELCMHSGDLLQGSIKDDEYVWSVNGVFVLSEDGKRLQKDFPSYEVKYAITGC